MPTCDNLIFTHVDIVSFPHRKTHMWMEMLQIKVSSAWISIRITFFFSRQNIHYPPLRPASCPACSVNMFRHPARFVLCTNESTSKYFRGSHSSMVEHRSLKKKGKLAGVFPFWVLIGWPLSATLHWASRIKTLGAFSIEQPHRSLHCNEE